MTLSTNGDLKYSNGSVATRKFQSVVSAFGERTEVDQARGSSANGQEFRPLFIVTQKLYSLLGWPTEEG
jgi:hypothetical protein